MINTMADIVALQNMPNCLLVFDGELRFLPLDNYNRGVNVVTEKSYDFSNVGTQFYLTVNSYLLLARLTCLMCVP